MCFLFLGNIGKNWFSPLTKDLMIQAPMWNPDQNIWNTRAVIGLLLILMLITWSLVMMPYISKIVGQVLCIYTAIVLNWNTFQFHNTLFINSKCMHIPTFYVLNAAFLFVRPSYTTVNTWRPRQDCRHFPDYIFKQILLNQNVTIPNKLCINLFRKFPNDNKSMLTHVMAFEYWQAVTWNRDVPVPLLIHSSLASMNVLTMIYWCFIPRGKFISTVNVRVLPTMVYYTPTQRSCWGVYWFHSVRPSVRLSFYTTFV